MDYAREVYAPMLAAGQEYQDFICKRLAEAGIVLNNLQSKKYQAEGENLLGLEIKFDRRLAETGTLYIEVAEKADPANVNWVESGPYRKDHTWLYGIGDYTEFYIFGKKMLQFFAVKYVQHHITNKTLTSRGFLLSRDQARTFCERMFLFINGENNE